MPRWRELLYISWDCAIVALVSLSLALILFDTLYALTPLPALLNAISPDLREAGGWLHRHFTTIDLWFVAILAFDVLAGWILAIVERRYHRWFFYPFVHWYDVLGCLPVSGLRVLRILRVIGLVIRLQRMGIVDVTRWRLFLFFNHYYQILLEELSDRVALKLLDNLQEEIRDSNRLPERVVERVLRPRKQQLIDDIAHRVNTLVSEGYGHNRDHVETWITGLIHRAVTENPSMRRLSRMPMGAGVVEALDETLADVVTRLIREAVIGMRSPEFTALAGELADSGFDVMTRVGREESHSLEEAMIEVLEIVKEEVATQRWKERTD
ncbi:preprotein translocase subunit SecA [Kushneria phosphatilytica]|nr:preprotein translocase subunit SecA [Kushneria phosphatilytica]